MYAASLGTRTLPSHIDMTDLRRMHGVFRARRASEMSRISTDYLFSYNINQSRIILLCGTEFVRTGTHLNAFSSLWFAATQNDTSRMKWLSLLRRERFCRLTSPQLRRSITSTYLNRCWTTVA